MKSILGSVPNAWVYRQFSKPMVNLGVASDQTQL